MKDITLTALPRGNNRTYRVTISNNGVACNITDWKLFFTLKRSYNDPDDHAVLRKLVTAHTDPTNGISDVDILPVDTDGLEFRKYYYDFKTITTDSKEYTLQKGTITIDYTVSRRDTQ